MTIPMLQEAAEETARALHELAEEARDASLHVVRKPSALGSWSGRRG
jgi:hypothetical protein